ncbi:MAG: SPOR domain-containing protein [Bacteroidetes bacterium]|nr:SPOR domain-containing protein [Bacteroidota bacterium]
MKRIFLIAIFSVSLVFAKAQLSDNNLENIRVIKDVRIDSLLQKNKDMNEVIYLNTLKNIQGYRLQVITTNDRNKAIEVKTRLLTDFPGVKTYLIYHTPYFKIQMGNFREREDAEQLMNRVKQVYPTGVFIVPSRIELKPTKDGEIIL